MKGPHVLVHRDLLDQLTAERDRLREALEAAEWSGRTGYSCSACNAHLKVDDSGVHYPDCIVGRALGRPECGGGA